MKTNSVPKIRFKGFTDDWEQRKFGELYEKVSRKNDMTYGTEQIISVANMYYKVDANVKRQDYLKTYNIFELGDIAFEGNKSKHFAHGRFVENTIGNGIVSHVFDVFKPIMDFNLSFWKYYINYEGVMGPILTRVTKASTMMTNLVAKDFLNEDILVPSIAEQQKIGEYLSNLDHLITLHQRKCEQTKELKKFMLQKMFPKKGEKNPEIRFPGFTDDWEQRKLSSGLREYTDRVIVEDDKEYYQISVRNNFGGITLRGSKMGNKIGRKRQAKINLTKYPQTLIFTRQTVEQGGIGWVEKYCDGAIVTENMPTISLDTSVFSKYFLTNLFQTKIFYKNAILDNIEGGSAQIAIHESKFLSSTLLFPNLDEQEKIGSFFKQIDETITLHQRKCEQLKELKKFMLQNMFPKKG